MTYALPLMTDALKRSRLFDLLDAHKDRQNTLITGQAAQGKTTLLSTYLNENGLPTIWINLKKDDRDHAKLFSRLSRAVQQQNHPEKPSLSNSILGTQKDVLRHVEAMVQLLNQVSAPLVVVFDDLEQLANENTGFDFIRHLVETRFENIKIFMLTRQMPQLNFAWLKLAKSLFVLTNDDLSFTLDETRDFFMHKSGVSQEDIEKIHRVTDGWAGGLTLVSESFRQLKGKFNLPDRLTAEVFNYFSHEIYQQLESSTRQFLIKTAVLDIIDPEIVEHLFGAPDMLEILKELENRNLFIQRLEYGTGSPKYKYHHLFRKFLIKDLSVSKGESYVEDLNRDIGLYFWEKRDHESALDYFLKADAFEEIIRIIRIKGTDLVIKGNFPSLKKWINCLPEDMVEKDPWLIFFQTMTHRIQGGKKNIQQFQKSLLLFEQNKDTRGILLCVGFLIEAAVFIRQSSSTILELIAKGNRYLLELREGERYPWARALLWQHIGLGYIAGTGDLSKGISACRNAILMGQQINTPDLMANASIIMTFGHVQAGDFSNAEQMLDKIKEISQVIENPEYRALKRIVDINFAMNRGKMDKARKLLRESEADIETFGLIFLYPAFIEAKALHSLYTGQFDEAYQLADHLRDFSILEGNDFYEGIASRIRATGLYLEGAYSEAKEEIDQALISLDPLKKGEIHYFQALQVLGLIQLYQEELRPAEKTLSRVRQFFDHMSFELYACEAYLALGYVSWDLGDQEDGFNYMNIGLEKAVREEYLYFPMLQDEMLIRSILILTVKGKIDFNSHYIHKLISSFHPAEVMEHFENLYPELCKKTNQETMDRITQVYKRLLPKLYVKTLGQFTIHLGEVILDQKRFNGAKPVMLLKSLALHGGNDIPKEVLIDDLWPDATTKAGEKNFKINLHRLRKAIEPKPRKEIGYSYIIQKAGLISIDPDLVKLDSDLFIQIFNQGMTLENENNYDLAIAKYEEASQLYKGDYFSEELYLDWIRQRRDLYRTRYLELLTRKARLHEELDQIDGAIDTWYLALDTDPCFETAYQNLMILFADTGQKSRAIDVFHTCEKMLQSELGSEPDAQTLEIFRQIGNK